MASDDDLISNPVGRRKLLQSVGAGSGILLAGCVGGPGQEPSPSPTSEGGGGSTGEPPSTERKLANNLVVFSWYEQWHERMLEKFREQHSGLETSLTAYGSNQEAYSKLKAAGTDSVDFVLPSNNMLITMREDDMIQPIDTSLLSNWELQKPIADRAPWNGFLKADGEYWGIPFARGSYMNVTTQSKIDEGVVPSDLVKSWDIYFENTDARTAIKDYGRRNVSVVIWHIRGQEGDINADPGNNVSWQEIEDKLVEMIENSKAIYSSSEEARRLIKNDQIDVANVWGGDVIQLRNLSGVSDAVGFLPTEGSNGWFDSFCVPKNAPHSFTSHKYMDFLLKPENMLLEYEIEGNIAVQEGLLDRMSQAKKDKFGFLLNMETTNLQPYAPDKELQNRATQAWNNAKTRAQ